MPYNSFTLEKVEATFGLTTRLVPLFPSIETVPIPAGLEDWLAGGQQVAAVMNEKARSEFIVAPILTAVGRMIGSDQLLSIYSGQWLDVDASKGLIGECDFILARTSPVPRLKAPLLTILEAKRGDIELGLGQCAAQMVATRMFNEQAGEPPRPMFGAVTTGENWQFLKLDGADLWLDRRLYFLNELGAILSVLHAIVTS